MTEIKIKSMSKSKSNQQTCLPDRQTTNDKPAYRSGRQQTTYTLCALLLALCLLTFTSTTTATIRYVSHTGTSTPPYTSWETAADSIQKAIDICEPGDTVLVANGVYYENLIMNTTISLIGSSVDSTVIDGSGLEDITIRINQTSSIQNLKIHGKGDGLTNSIVIYVDSDSVGINNCILSHAIAAVFVRNNCLIENLIVKNIRIGFGHFGITTISSSYFKNNVIIISSNNANAINAGVGSYYITNNIILFTGDQFVVPESGINATFPKKIIIYNNLISGFYNNIQINGPQETAISINNILNNNRSNGFGSFNIVSGNVMTGNLIIANNKSGLYGGNNSNVLSNYNLFWNNISNYTNVTPGDSDLVADPMFVNDTIPISNFNFDYHLQAYSPAIDAGDPNILDVDGSRSDIGMYGGPFGESYKYKDLAPKPPRNLSAIVDSNQIFVKWNRNTEADTSHYNVYRDTVANFAIDSTKLISSQTDTFYIQYPPYQSSRYVYKITCVDNQGNESLPSEELVINITSLTMNDYPMTISDYVLFQNYPNPFNPSTTIAYKLKERAYVKLMVYDIKGELISVIVNKEQESGYYEVEFNVGNGLQSVPNNLASGIYLYRIEVIGEGRIPVYSDMKKMLLVK